MRKLLDWGFVEDNKWTTTSFPLIPWSLLKPWLDLVFVMAEESLEVSCKLIHRKSEPRWNILIPPQTVTSSYILGSDGPCLDLLTGQELPLPPVGWLEAGSMHSHHSMEPIFSRLDDKLELQTVGLHIVVGSLPEPSINCSVVLDKKRYYLNAGDCLETKEYIFSPDKLGFHPNIKSIIYKATH